ncbi:MAG: acetyl-CoA carboxylase biotin carboxylase subunit [Lachnospiraceae bacterium]|jgi:acetyl-CoA carboxylase biotin carboxylase subunit
MFSRILIANRGEIAVRIIRACREMGIETVAVYSEADADALHVQLADASFCIGPAPASESYLNETQIIRAALISGAQAIHPGYGFLSENAHFARECRKNGIVFIGPDPDVMEKLSDKAELKKQAEAAGLTVIPGTLALSGIEEALEEAKRIGYPLMLKACAGGGGRGIRMVEDDESLRAAWPEASAEAAAAFGDGSLYLEKCIYPARHVELQILADEQGGVVVLGERDCSVQRHNQKLIEETPSPAVNGRQRDRMIKMAAQAARKLHYTGAGTMEFLLDRDGNFWFMEMNVRLQVEHTVTEMLTGIDIVKWQIRIAAGIPLAMSQKDIHLDGDAIECRINAGGCGTLKTLHVPGGPNVRFDTALVEGGSVSPYYDSLLGKLAVKAGTREEALRKMRAALSELVIEGIPCNVEEQLRILEDETFTSGAYNLTFIPDWDRKAGK